MLNKEGKLTITISVDTTELDEAIKKTKELLELQEKVNRPLQERLANKEVSKTMLPGLTEEQNEYLEELHIKAIDTAQSFFEDYANTRKDEYSELAKAELAKARAYLILGNFDSDARL